MSGHFLLYTSDNSTEIYTNILSVYQRLFKVCLNQGAKSSYSLLTIFE